MAAPISQMEPHSENEPWAWAVHYQAALSETDEKLLPGAVAQARESITRRRVGLHVGKDDREIQALDIALKTLRVLHSNWV